MHSAQWLAILEKFVVIDAVLRMDTLAGQQEEHFLGVAMVCPLDPLRTQHIVLRHTAVRLTYNYNEIRAYPIRTSLRTLTVTLGSVTR